MWLAGQLVHGAIRRSAAQQATWAWLRAGRQMSSWPEHTVIGMPSLSPTMDRGNIVEWKVKEGDSIKPGDLLAEIETDKATIGFENQEDGVVAKILAPAGSKDVPINSPVLVLVDDASLVPAFKNFTVGGSAAAPSASAAAAPSEAAPAAASQPAAPSVPVNSRLGPAARMLLEVSGLSVNDITPTGPNGIVTKGDVLAAIEAGVKPGASKAPAKPASPTPAATPPPAASTTAAPAAATPAPSKPAQQPAATSTSDGGYTDTPTTQIRKVIAQRLLDSKVGIPALYGAIDVELDALAGLRRTLAEQGVKLSVNDFVLKAIAMALKEVPGANSLWDGKAKESVPASGIDISVAVATERGLITPIVKGADAKTVSQISKDVKELAAKARANKLKPEEFMGGSFTVSNLGMFGTAYFNAIINPPQGAILAVGAAQQKVTLQDGKPVAHSYMTVTLSADHRMYDGELLAQVLNAFKRNIQSPVNLVM